MTVSVTGSLALLGTGIKFLSHLTKESIAYIENADVVYYLSNDSIMIEWLENKCNDIESLSRIYFKHASRKEAYSEIDSYLIERVRAGLNICFLLYGHPVVFSQPGMIAIHVLENEGYTVKVLPAISSEDCLFADLRINPGSVGCLSYDATDLLIRNRQLLPTSHLIVWQIASVGYVNHYKEKYGNDYIELLVQKLLTVYPGCHAVAIYIAAKYPGFESRTFHCTIASLASVDIPRFSTMYIPPLMSQSLDERVLNKLGIDANAAT